MTTWRSSPIIIYYCRSLVDAGTTGEGRLVRQSVAIAITNDTASVIGDHRLPPTARAAGGAAMALHARHARRSDCSHRVIVWMIVSV
jgi:hypothetical protein